MVSSHSSFVVIRELFCEEDDDEFVETILLLISSLFDSVCLDDGTVADKRVVEKAYGVD